MTIRRKRTEVTVETETRVVWRRTSPGKRAWCAECAAETFLVTLDAAAIVTGLTVDSIYARIAGGALHVREVPGGGQLVCGLSLGLSQPQET
jgi:hypothetical protein